MDPDSLNSDSGTDLSYQVNPDQDPIRIKIHSGSRSNPDQDPIRIMIQSGSRVLLTKTKIANPDPDPGTPMNPDPDPQLCFNESRKEVQDQGGRARHAVQPGLAGSKMKFSVRYRVSVKNRFY